MQITGKTLWITGASSGIGRAVAIELSLKRCHLILSSRKKEDLEKVAIICENNGSTTSVIPFDLGNALSIEKAANRVLENETNIDGLYHFGGISQRSYVSDTAISVDRKIFEVNFFGTIELTKRVLPVMISNGGGQIGVTSSIVGKFGFPYRSSYAASKHALHGFFESLRAENVSNSVLVSMIIPGRIKTNISVNALDKDGNAHNKMDAGQDKGMSAEKAAGIIVKRLEKEKKEILVGGSELIMVHIRRFFPRLYYYLSTKVEPL
ncbi:SDR family NAD(P)-dependent oxidoreductase [Lutimonas halocynthiae]|uniref:SDR family NAD(P)-dependent oxidoreductase n=1 Tax=Lutimonas halocynthiae TaxID=1446477 RepID=UPI0025B3F4A6|nr:SDR family NAD(P)-dependent oxidoreductase [Lutimonas halocynthiae]MDN3641220.1 SDR family NAD(P)-dependent oxidoreductase [Lutimonas halocynthiae]